MEATGTCFVSLPAALPKAPVQASATTRIVNQYPAEQTASSDGADPAGPVTPLQSLGLPVQDTLARDFMRFKVSAAPSRVLFYADEAWSDFPAAVFETLKEGFMAGKAIMDVPDGDSLYIFDFIRMLRVDLATSAQNSIAWIDVNGRCFFPVRRDETGVVCPKLEIDVRVNGNNGGEGPSGKPIVGNEPPPEPPEEHSDESKVMPVASGLRLQRWAGLQVLDEGDSPYKALENVFLTGMRELAPETRITSICRFSCNDQCVSYRCRVYMTQVEITKDFRGTANVRLGWYGTCASAIPHVNRYDFHVPNNHLLGPEVQATGVYIAPVESPHASSLLAVAGDGGEKHVILCRVILGNTEKVDMCSAQSRPSSDEFDCGVDDLEKPRWYIVWCSRMYTRVLPLYVVSFVTSDSGSRVSPVKEISGKRTSKKKLAMPINKLFAELGNSLTSSRMEVLETLLSRLKEGKTSQAIFLKELRAIAGDKLINAAMRKFNKCE